MNHQKRENGAAFLAECMILNPYLKSLPIVQEDIVRKYEEEEFDVLTLIERASSLGTNTAAEAQVRLAVVEEMLSDTVEILQAVAINLSHMDNPQVQGLVAGIEDYLTRMGE